MFFILSKTLGFFASPSNVLISIGLVGIVLLCTRFRRLASWLVVTSLVLIAFAGFSPLGNILILPLEAAFPAVGRFAWAAGRHCRPRRRDFAGSVDGARRGRAQ